MYREIQPGYLLQQYVKCYFIFEQTGNIPTEDTVYPSGCTEIIFNLGSGSWLTAADGHFVTHPPVEWWGQLTQPLPVKSFGNNTMLGIRLLPHGAARFLKDPVSLFNNQVMDFTALDKKTKQLHARLLETATWRSRLELVEAFLSDQLTAAPKRLNKLTIVQDAMQELQQEEGADNMTTLAARYGITARYLQKLFLQYTGLTPKLYSQINRFQNSLQLVSKKAASLTAIAYECGYADQSHFIKEFKSFTGSTPSGLVIHDSPLNLVMAGSLVNSQ